MDKNGDVYVPLLEEDDIELGGTREKDFIGDVYGEVINISKRTRETGVYRQDFMFDMFHVITDNRPYWWMSVNHPMAVMLFDSGVQPMEFVQGRTGTACVFTDNAVQEGLDALVEMCKRAALPIIDEDGKE